MKLWFITGGAFFATAQCVVRAATAEAALAAAQANDAEGFYFRNSTLEHVSEITVGDEPKVLLISSWEG
jgi:hypothetical protein